MAAAREPKARAPSRSRPPRTCSCGPAVPGCEKAWKRTSRCCSRPSGINGEFWRPISISWSSATESTASRPPLSTTSASRRRASTAKKQPCSPPCCPILDAIGLSRPALMCVSASSGFCNRSTSSAVTTWSRRWTRRRPAPAAESADHAPRNNTECTQQAKRIQTLRRYPRKGEARADRGCGNGEQRRRSRHGTDSRDFPNLECHSERTISHHRVQHTEEQRDESRTMDIQKRAKRGGRQKY